MNASQSLKDVPIDGSVKVRTRLQAGALGLVLAGGMALGLTACAHKDSRAYDIGPVFPLSSGKCAKYDGQADGSGFGAHCWVTKANCERAASDWRNAMTQSGVTDAIEFRC